MRLSTATATILPLVLFVWAIIYGSADLVMWDWVGFMNRLVSFRWFYSELKVENVSMNRADEKDTTFLNH
jgi:hypothetical protein